ncbi:hypothetical protein PXD04_06570 [Methanosphaera sp. ISO3-F5]|uniref:hypothetical protein n=1 Tax=Methanosphaera sp. ISO3-F5 TaxID=1452353 RepID=UPI002B25738C|nr:hypothetical protein [Methanosphaera sp. ISO3-F5]WQH63369.1 hypothetical protein PXD04_06570 [Methanosphaera sp. ISO3-F5]
MSATTDLIKTIEEEPGVMIVELMTDDMKKQVLQHEMKRLDELVPFINQGMEEAFKEEEALVIVLNNDERPEREMGPEDVDNNSFTLRTESGQIIGETIYDEEELEDLRNDPNVFFLSDNFVTYNNLATLGEKQFFVMTSSTSSFFTDEDLESMVTSLKVAVPSTGTDHYIKDCFELSHEERIGTLIIGFTE